MASRIRVRKLRIHVSLKKIEPGKIGHCVTPGTPSDHGLK